MADQQRWTDERESDASAQERRFRQGPGAYREAYGDYGRSFERDAARAYGAAYGIDQDRYGGRWGRGPEGSGGEAEDVGPYGQPPGARYVGGPDRTWMARTGERVAEFFGGGEVQIHHRGRGPKNYTRPDERIREDLNERLTDDRWLDASEIEVEVASGEVTLSGMVASREDRRRAEDLAERVPGVRHVQNNIRVQSQDASGRQEPTA